MTAEEVRAVAAQIAATAPKLTPAQADRVRTLLRGPR